VEAIGTYSNRGRLCKKFADLRKRIKESARRPSRTRRDGPPPRSKRFLTADELADIRASYEVGATTNHIANRYGISKTRVANLLREQDVTIRRQGLTEEQATEAATLYAVGRSLAWLAGRYEVSPMTISKALRRHGVTLRPRPGWP
jgi:hypothetical protein